VLQLFQPSKLGHMNLIFKKHMERFYEDRSKCPKVNFSFESA